MLLEILEVKQGAVGDGPIALAGDLAPAVQPGLQRFIAQALHGGPRQLRRPGAQDGGSDDAVTEAEALADGPVASPQGELLTQDFAGVAHGQSLGGHSSPFGRAGPWAVPRRYAPAILPVEDAAPTAVGRPMIMTMDPISVATMPISVTTIDRFS